MYFEVIIAASYGKDTFCLKSLPVHSPVDVLYNYAEKGFVDIEITLQHLFKPLNYEYAIAIHQKSKASIKNGWLRLYGIRLSPKLLFNSGGGVKLTKDMRMPHLQIELKKLDQARIFLQNDGIDYPEDFKCF